MTDYPPRENREELKQQALDKLKTLYTARGENPPTFDSQPEELERHLRQQLREIDERAKLEAAPILAKLAELAALRPMAPLVVHTCLLCNTFVAPGMACPKCNP